MMNQYKGPSVRKKEPLVHFFKKGLFKRRDKVTPALGLVLFRDASDSTEQFHLIREAAVGGVSIGCIDGDALEGGKGLVLFCCP